MMPVRALIDGKMAGAGRIHSAAGVLEEWRFAWVSGVLRGAAAGRGSAHFPVWGRNVALIQGALAVEGARGEPGAALRFLLSGAVDDAPQLVSATDFAHAGGAAVGGGLEDAARDKHQAAAANLRSGLQVSRHPVCTVCVKRDVNSAAVIPRNLRRLALSVRCELEGGLSTTR